MCIRMKLNALASAALLLDGGLAAAAAAGKFSILSMNVAGLPAWLNNNGVPGDKAEVAALIGTKFAEHGYDVIHLQEVRCLSETPLMQRLGRWLTPTPDRTSTTTPTSTAPTRILTGPPRRAASRSGPASTPCPTSTGSTSDASSGRDAPTSPRRTA